MADLRSYLRSREFFTAFSLYLKKNAQLADLLFFCSAELLNLIPFDTRARRKKILEIHKIYIKDGAIFQVSLNRQIRITISEVQDEVLLFEAQDIIEQKLTEEIELRFTGFKELERQLENFIRMVPLGDTVFWDQACVKKAYKHAKENEDLLMKLIKNKKI